MVRGLWLGLALLLATLGNAAAQSLTFDASFSPSTIGPGANSRLTFSFDNPGGAPVSDAAFTNSLPAGVTVSGTPSVSSTCPDGEITAAAGGGMIALTGGSVGAFGSCEISLLVTASADGVYNNTTGDLTSSAGNSGSANAELTVTSGRPGFSKSFAPSTVNVGERTTLTYTIDNSANASPIIALGFSDQFPSGLAIANPPNAATTCDGMPLTAVAGAGGLTTGIGGSLSAGASCTVEVDLTASGPGRFQSVSSSLTFSTGGPSAEAGSAAATLEVAPLPEGPSLTKSFDGVAVPGGIANLTFTITNNDRDAAASGISFTDDLNAMLSGAMAVGPLPADPCGAGSSLSGGGLLSFSGGSLAGAERCSFSVPVQVPAGAATGGYLNTTSSLAATLDGQPYTADPASETLFVDDAQIEATKSFIDDPVGTGGTVTLEYSLTNLSSTLAATDIAFQEPLAPLSGLSVLGLPASGFCGSGSSLAPAMVGGDLVLFFSGGQLAAAGSCSFQVTLGVPLGAAAGSYGFTSSQVSSVAGGMSRLSPPSSDDLTVFGGDLTLIKEFLDDPVVPGGSSRLRFTLSHDAEASAPDITGISFTDDLDAMLSGASASGLPAAPCGAGSEVSGSGLLTFTGGSLSAGEVCSFEVDVAVPGGALPGDYDNATSTVNATQRRRAASPQRVSSAAPSPRRARSTGSRTPGTWP